MSLESLIVQGDITVESNPMEPLSNSITYPIHYKMIPTQYAFYICNDGKLKIRIVSKVPTELQFKSKKEAEDYIKKYERHL